MKEKGKRAVALQSRQQTGESRGTDRAGLEKMVSRFRIQKMVPEMRQRPHPGPWRSLEGRTRLEVRTVWKMEGRYRWRWRGSWYWR